MRIIKHNSQTATFDDSQEVKDAVFEKIIAFATKHNAWAGEVIFQSDSANLGSIELVCEIFDDIIKAENNNYED